MKRHFLGISTCILWVVFATAAWNSVPTAPNTLPETGVCTPPSDYYEIKLVGTKKVRGARTANGLGEVTFAASPFGVAISPTGTYSVNLDLTMKNVKLDPTSSLVAWFSTPQIDQIRLIGRFDEAFTVSGSTDWNKFLVVITLEPSDKPLGETWTGPIVARGMSRSGLMHTLAGHGPYETEPCAVYGY